MKKILFIIIIISALRSVSQCPTPITFSINSTAPTCSTCCNGSLTVTNIQNGCPPYNIQILPSATMTSYGTFINLCSGTTYTVKVLDGGCCGQSSLICSMSYSPSCPTPINYSIQITPPTCSGCCDGSAQIINLSGGCGTPYSAVWIPAGSPGLIVNNLCSGNYSVMVNDAQGGSCCPSVTQGCSIPLGVTTNINETTFINNLIIFPNPLNSTLNINDAENQFQNSIIEIVNFLGQKVLLIPFEQQINVASLQSGFYTIKIKNNKGLVYSNKFIKQE